MVLVKYPRTPHLPWSPGTTSDDRIIDSGDLERLNAEPTIITEKMDGGNVTLTHEHFYARSLDSGTPRWEKYAKAEWARVSHDIPEGWRVSAESMWARRSIAYDDLDGPLLVFGVWSDTRLLSWDDVEEWTNLLGLPTVPVIGHAVGTSPSLSMWKKYCNGLPRESEGFVVRAAKSVPVDEFARNVVKWVRDNHVTTPASWRHSRMTPNGFVPQ